MGISDFQVFFLPRTLCALGLIWYHSTMAIALLSPNRTTELLEAWKTNQLIDTFSSLGPVCIDLLFVMSGFFTTMKIIMMLEASTPLSPWRFVIYRWLRFFPMLLCLLVVAFVFKDAVFWSSGSFDWRRGLMLFGWQNHASQEWLDFSTLPAWVLSVEMHGAILLAAFVPMLYRLDQKPTQQLWMFTLAAINIRGYMLATSDPDCYLRECVGSVASFLPSAGPTFSNELKKLGWKPLAEDVKNACPSLCEGVTSQEQFGAYLPTMLLPSYMHFVPFFLGTILFFEYISAYQRTSDSNKRSWSAWSSLLIGPSLVWLLYVHQALPDDFHFLLHFLLPPAFREALWPLLYAGSWCGVLFCALVPVAHPAKSFPTTRLLSLPAFELPSRYSFGLCLFHWPVQWLLFRHFTLPLPDSPFLAAVFTFLVVLTCTAPVAIAFELLIDSPWRAFLRRTIMKQLPSIQSLEDRPVSPPDPLSTPSEGKVPANEQKQKARAKKQA